MRILHIGDIVGKPGREIIVRRVAGFDQTRTIGFRRRQWRELGAGSGITPAICKELIAAGVDCITLGDHIYRRAEIMNTLQRELNIVKPANYPADAPGPRSCDRDCKERHPCAVISLMGRVFMKPVDCPFQAADRVLAKIPARSKSAGRFSRRSNKRQATDGPLSRWPRVVCLRHAHACTNRR